LAGSSHPEHVRTVGHACRSRMSSVARRVDA
jgi:hypothetical protein